MEQTVSVSVDALTQAFSAAFRQEFQPLKQELQTLAANSTSQHLDNGTGTSRIACEGDSMANIKRKYTINGESVWIQGKSEQDILEKACALMGAQTRPAPAAKHNFRAYALDWFKNFSLPNVEQVTAITYKRELDFAHFPRIRENEHRGHNPIRRSSIIQPQGREKRIFDENANRLESDFPKGN